VPTLREYATEFRRLSDELDASLSELAALSAEWAEKEVGHKKAWAVGYIKSTQPNQKGRESDATMATGDSLLGYLMAEPMARVAREAVESRRTQISALQSLLAAERNANEAELYGPET